VSPPENAVVSLAPASKSTARAFGSKMSPAFARALATSVWVRSAATARGSHALSARGSRIDRRSYASRITPFRGAERLTVPPRLALIRGGVHLVL
jgi:hypothetical protein